MQMRTRGILEMASAMIISGTVGWCVLATGMPAVAVVFWRCTFGAVVMLLVCGGLKLLRWGALGIRQMALAAVGGLALIANWVLLFAAYSYSSIAVATVTYHTQPFMLVGIGALLFGEKLTANQLGWLSVAFIGVLLIVSGGLSAGSPGSRYLLGVGLALAAALFYAITAAITKRLRGVPPHLIVTIQMIVGTLALMPFATWPDSRISPHAWGLLLTIGAIHTGLMSTLLYGAVQKISTALVGILAFIYPIIAIGVDAWAFGHVLSVIQVAGAMAILVAVAGMNFGWWEKRKIHGQQNGA